MYQWQVQFKLVMMYEAGESHQAADVYYLRAAVKAGVLGVRGTHCAGPSLAQMSPCTAMLCSLHPAIHANLYFLVG